MGQELGVQDFSLTVRAVQTLQSVFGVYPLQLTLANDYQTDTTRFYIVGEGPGGEVPKNITLYLIPGGNQDPYLNYTQRYVIGEYQASADLRIVLDYPQFTVYLDGTQIYTGTTYVTEPFTATWESIICHIVVDDPPEQAGAIVEVVSDAVCLVDDVRYAYTDGNLTPTAARWSTTPYGYYQVGESELWPLLNEQNGGTCKLVWPSLYRTFVRKPASLLAEPGHPAYLYDAGGQSPTLVTEWRWDVPGDIAPVWNYTPDLVRSVAVWTTRDGHRYVVVEAGGKLWLHCTGYIAGSLSNWESTPVQIATGYKSPSAVQLTPSADVLLFSIDEDDDVLHVSRLTWKPTGYEVGAPLSVGVTASATGGGWVTPDGTIYLCYADTDGAVQVIHSEDGDTWSA